MSLLSTLIALAIVLGLAWVVLKLLKRTQLAGGRAAADGPQVVRAVSLGARERLVVVHHRGVEYLLGVTAAQVTLVAQQPLPPADTDDVVPGGG